MIDDCSAAHLRCALRTPPQPRCENGRCGDVQSRQQQKFHVEHEADPRQLERLGLCLAMVAHEVRNLLTPVRLRSEAEARRCGDERTRAALVLAADRSVAVSEAMDAILGTLAGKSEGSSFDVLEEVNRATDQLESGGTTVNVDVPRGTVACGSGVAFRLAVHNLIRNALESCPGARVQVRSDACDEGDSVLVTVTDTGRGLPTSVVADPYRAFQSSHKGGSGLGLSIAAMLLRSCGGDIALANTGPTGTSWAMTLRRAAPNNATKAA